MSFDLDATLLDKFFQPVADRLSAGVSCFDLSRACLLLAVLLQLVVLSLDLSVEADLVKRLMAVGITLLAIAGGQQARHAIARAERQARPGRLNIRRITMRWQRVSWLVVLTWAVSVALGTGTAANVAVSLACCGWLGCIYFVSCTPSPPMFRSRKLATIPIN